MALVSAGGAQPRPLSSPVASRYTQVPRPTLWLVEECEADLGGDGPDELPRFRASIESFYLGKSLVTNAQYEAFEPRHARCAASSGDDQPVVNVSFREAVAYCDWYAQLSKKAFRLPTETEWEHACRARTRTRFSWGDDPEGGSPFAWTAENSGRACHDVETLRPNPLGLHDTLGLCWEWTSSLCFPVAPRPADGRDDPSERGARSVRGGSFRTPVAELSCGRRLALDEDDCRDDLGFRIARSL